MEMLSPPGPFYQAGTLSGNPLAMTAGIETLKLLKKKGAYEKLLASSAALCEGIEKIAKRRGVGCRVQRAGSMFTLFFTPDKVENYSDAKKSDTSKSAASFSRMTKSGIFLPPSQCEVLPHLQVERRHQSQSLVLSVENTLRVH